MRGLGYPSLETDTLGWEEVSKSFKQGTECGRSLLLVAGWSEAGGREAGRRPCCDPGERCQWAEWIWWWQGEKKGEIWISPNAQ